ncbi:MAG: metallophosphoesterase family protein [Gemmatimonadota bacterium]|jgi:putative phosphoesterase
MEIGLISDTHGLLRPEVLLALDGCEEVLHAGDVGSSDILEALQVLGPVHAVRGNTDHGELGRALPLTEWVEVGGVTLYMVHILDDLDIDPVAAGVDAVIYGHTHRPKVEDRNGVLYVNPGSCGPRRFDLPVTVARLSVDGDGGLSVRLVPLTSEEASA